MMEETILWLTSKTGIGSGEFFDKTIQSLKQNEWDVEVEMRPASLVYKSDEMLPKLDADGCLILKRVV